MFNKEQFISPDKDFATAYGMVWSTSIEKEELRKFMLTLKDIGVRKLYVLPEPKEFRPVTIPTTMSPDYMSEEFLNLMEYFCKTANELGFSVWLYDEGGWPSGSACTQIVNKRPDLRRKWITPMPIELANGMEYNPPKGQKSFLAAFYKDEECNHTRIDKTFIYGGKGEVVEYRFLDNFNTYMFNDDYNTDILKRETANLFLKLTHEKYKEKLGKYFGSFIPYIFNDEPSVEPYAWTEGLEKRFLKDFGYDILDYLPVIRQNEKAKTEKQKQAICDFKKTLCSLATENFFIPIKEWCNKNNIGFIGHLDNDHSAETFVKNHCYAYPLDVLRCYDVPGVDVIWRQIYPEGYGAPCFQNTVAFFPLFASSAASQIGSRYSLTESLAVYGMSTTPSIMRYVFGAQAVRGINLFNILSTNPSKDIIRPYFRPENPNFNHLPEINRYLERLAYLNTLGLREVENALYMPCDDIMKGDDAQSFHNLGRRLEENHISFEIIDDTFLNKAEIKDNKLCMGFAAYKNVFIPENATIGEDLKKKIEGFIKTEAESVCVCDNKNIILQKRKLENGDLLYFAFNEHKDTQSVTLGFKEKLPCYRIVLEEGRIERTESLSFSLTMGETAVFLLSNEEISAEVPLSVVDSIVLDNNYIVKKQKEFVIDQTGTYLNEVNEKEFSGELGGFKKYFGNDFSGTVTYTRHFKLTKDFLDADAMVIDLGEVEYSADVTVNDKKVGIVSLMPYRIRVDKEVFAEENVIKITVANTPSNAILDADIYSWYSQGEIGPYHTRVGVFEREFLGGGLIGPVKIEKLA